MDQQKKAPQLPRTAMPLTRKHELTLHYLLIDLDDIREPFTLLPWLVDQMLPFPLFQLLAPSSHLVRPTK